MSSQLTSRFLFILLCFDLYIIHEILRLLFHTNGLYEFVYLFIFRTAISSQNEILHYWQYIISMILIEINRPIYP